MSRMWCECEVCMFMSERECICWHEWDILGGKYKVEKVDRVTQHMDHDVTCLNPSVLAPFYIASMRLKGIGERAPAILNNT